MTATTAGLLLAVLFLAAVYGFYLTEYASAEDELQPTVLAAVAEYHKNPQEPNLRTIITANTDLSIAVFDKRGYALARFGNVRVPLFLDSGRNEIAGLPVVAQVHQFSDGTVVAVAGWRTREIAVRRFATLLAVLWFPLVGIFAAIPWFASRSTFEPLERLARQAEALSAQDLSGRLQIEPGEYAGFAERLNRFLDRLEKAVRREERFVSDAAHELRTPLTVMKGRLETNLLRARNPEEYRETLREVLIETERLAGLVEMLLQSATMVQGEVPSIDLEEQCERAHARWVDMFAQHEVELELSSQSCSAKMKLREFEVIIDNLLSNALKVSPKGSHCCLAVHPEGGLSRIEVTDQGPGVPPEFRETIFERFARLDVGRSRDVGGFGIGLAVCRRIVEGRGGHVYLQPSDVGAHFVVDLPN
ncbi:MAG TPA: HAMP domain-containing sensor histidine kinase [Fimbriimonas sp.]|nr:HAMP domain-containing sensor histidine kinase [Fimbriimonas sp.]